LPVEDHVMTFLHNLNHWLKTTNGQLSGINWINSINHLQVSNSVDNEACVVEVMQWMCHL